MSARRAALAGAPWLAALALAGAVCAATWRDLPCRSDDYGWYQRLAAGRGEEVVRPFATRVLHPLAVRGVRAAGSLDLDAAFRLVGIASVLVLCWAVGRRLRGPLWLAPLLLWSPLLLQLFRDHYLPDLWHAALLALLVLAWPARPAASLLLLAALMLTRESTLLLAPFLAVQAAADGRRRLAAGVAAATAAGLAAVWWLLPAGQANVHAIGQGLYLALKVPFNLARNLFGLELWANTLDYCQPRAVWPLPEWLRGGAVHTVGFCGFNALRPLALLVSWLTAFGLLPGLAWQAWRTRPRGRAGSLGAWLMYGWAAFLIAPALGAATGRLVEYGWPAFWIAAPLLAWPRLASAPARDLWRLAALHQAIAWLPELLRPLAPSEPARLALAVAAALVLHALAWKIYSRRPRDAAPSAAPGAAAQNSV